jgi:hypothetical protein
MTTEINKNRTSLIETLLESYKESKEKRTETFDYQDRPKTLEVIRIDPNALLLNHDNSRVKAQLLDHPSRRIVEQDPTSVEAQEVLATLLRETEKFKALKEELKILGQKQVGLISRDGLLVNGNTRVVALRDLGISGVDVAVLPRDAGPREFLDLEMSLQMAQLTHQDYTFTNELLLIERYKDFGHNDLDIARKMNWLRNGKKKVDQKFQLLSLVKELRDTANPPLAYSTFDAKKQHLIDLNDEYQMMISSGDVQGAERMKWGRFISMFLQVNKDQTRVIKDDFFEESILDRIDGSSKLQTVFEGLKRVPVSDGLDDLLGNDISEQIDLKALTTKIVAELADDKGYITKDLSPEFIELQAAIRGAAEGVISKGKFDSYLFAPSEILSETRISLESVVEKFEEVSKLKEFDAKRFEFVLSKVKKSLNDLVKDFEKYKESKNK